jgi:hypothetical protein
MGPPAAFAKPFNYWTFVLVYPHHPTTLYLSDSHCSSCFLPFLCFALSGLSISFSSQSCRKCPYYLFVDLRSSFTFTVY